MSWQYQRQTFQTNFNTIYWRGLNCEHAESQYGRMAVLHLLYDKWQQLDGSKAVTTNKKLIHQVDRNNEKGNLGERKVATQQWIQRLVLSGPWYFVVCGKFSNISEEPTASVLQGISSSERLTNIYLIMYCHMPREGNIIETSHTAGVLWMAKVRWTWRTVSDKILHSQILPNMLYDSHRKNEWNLPGRLPVM